MWCPIANGYGFGTRAVMKSHQILTINSSPPRGTFAWKRIQKDFFIVSLFHRFLFACVKIFGCFLSASETLESRVFTSSKGSIGGTTQSLLGLHDSKKNHHNRHLPRNRNLNNVSWILWDLQAPRNVFQTKSISLLWNCGTVQHGISSRALYELEWPFAVAAVGELCFNSPICHWSGSIISVYKYQNHHMWYWCDTKHSEIGMYNSNTCGMAKDFSFWLVVSNLMVIGKLVTTMKSCEIPLSCWLPPCMWPDVRRANRLLKTL